MDFRGKTTGERRAGEAGKGIFCLWISEGFRWLSALGFGLNHGQHHGFRSIAAKPSQFLCFLLQPARKLSKRALKTCLASIWMDEGIFQYLSFFTNPTGTRIWQHYNVGERNSGECFASGVSSIVFSWTMGTSDTHTHTHHWPEGVFRKQCEKSKLNLHFYIFFVHLKKIII